MKSGIIETSGKKIPYKIIRRKGMRRMLLSFSAKGELVMTIPRLTPSLLINSFVKKSSDWIDHHLIHIEKRRDAVTASQSEYLEKREEARMIIGSRVEELARLHGFHYRKVSIRNQRTRFGSCSKSGNLSFHYQIAFFTEEERDYVIVHELCHLRHFDHSAEFWQEVAKFSPRYESIRKKLLTRSRA